MYRFRRAAPVFVLLSVVVMAAGFARPGRSQDARFPWPELPPATRGPLRVRFSSTGDRAYVAESDSNSVGVVDTRTGQVLQRFASGGEQPSDVAVLMDGSLLVLNRFSGSLVRLNGTTGAVLGKLPMLGEPVEMIVDGPRSTAYVTISALDQVAAVKLPELKLVRRRRVGRRPEAIQLTADRGRLLVAALQSGEVSCLDPDTLAERSRTRLPGRNLRAMALGGDGRAWITGQIPGNDQPTSDPLRVWTNFLFALPAEGEKASSAPTGPQGFSGALDSDQEATPDPDGVAVVDADHLVIASSGRDEVVRVRLPERSTDGQKAPMSVETRRHVGAHPRGVSVSPDGKQIWVANELDGTVSVLDSRTLEPVRTIALGIPRKRDLRLDGRYVFGSAALTHGGRFTCNSCHPDGGADGLTWRFTHVPDGVERRNTKNLRGSITLTAPFRWSGREKDIEVFFQEEIVGLFHGPRQEHETLHALWNILDQLFLPPNPHRLPGGKLTAAAAQGKRLFEGKAGCGGCHAGEYRGGTGKRAWVGTTRPGQTLDVPHLMGVYDSEPYLHDGSAPTLESVFAQHDPQHKHGNTRALTPAERAQLFEYVREL